ncbi:MAG TPA: hypothetical protein VFP42_09830 [Acidimicrobiia bacterium]|nr:hypothetical protein [Acidimicrobiia bacterium]
MRRTLSVAVMSVVLVLLFSSTALAFECTNVSKSDPAAGAQLVFGSEDEVLYMSKGLQNRIDKGLVDFETGEGFHGLIAFDFDGDGVADASTYIGVGPDGEIPLEAQFAGPACRGMTNLGIYFTQCVDT